MSNIKRYACCKLAGGYGNHVGHKYSKLEHVILVTLAYMKGRTYAWTATDVIAKTKIFALMGYHIFLTMVLCTFGERSSAFIVFFISQLVTGKSSMLYDIYTCHVLLT